MKPKDVKKLFADIRNVPVDTEFLRSLRLRLESDIRATPALARQPFAYRRVLSAVTAAGLFLGVSGTVFASQASLPGEPLYPVKKFTEEARLAVTPGDQSKAELRLSLAQERLKEINTLLSVKSGTPTAKANVEPLVRQAEKDFEDQLQNVSRAADNVRAAGELKKALDLNSQIFFSGESYKKLIEKGIETGGEDVQKHLESASSSADKIQERAKHEIEDIENEQENEDKSGGNENPKNPNLTPGENENSGPETRLNLEIQQGQKVDEKSSTGIQKITQNLKGENKQENDD